MKAGRDLDYIIAEKVMGLPVQKDQVTNILKMKSTDDPWDYFIGDSNVRIPCYSKDLEQAWAVIEKIRAVRIKRDSHDDLVTEVRISFEPQGHYEVRIIDQHCNTWGISESYFLPYAICMAALSVIGFNHEQTESSEEPLFV